MRIVLIVFFILTYPSLSLLDIVDKKASNYFQAETLWMWLHSPFLSVDPNSL